MVSTVTGRVGGRDKAGRLCAGKSRAGGLCVFNCLAFCLLLSVLWWVVCVCVLTSDGGGFITHTDLKVMLTAATYFCVCLCVHSCGSGGWKPGEITVV